jgi:hypothetical protein
LTESSAPLPAAQDMKPGHSNKEIGFEADALLQNLAPRGQHRRAKIMPYTNSNTATTAPHRKNAALSSQSPYQQRTTQRDNPTQQLIKQAVDYLLEQLEAGKSETLTAYLAAMARFHAYSFGNILSIARQRPTATRVAGFHTWKELGRFVKRGEKGIQILAPMVGHRRRNDDAGRNRAHDDNAKPAPVLIGFRAVYVFDRLSRDLRPARLATMFRSLAGMDSLIAVHGFLDCYDDLPCEAKFG